MLALHLKIFSVPPVGLSALGLIVDNLTTFLFQLCQCVMDIFFVLWPVLLCSDALPEYTQLRKPWQSDPSMWWLKDPNLKNDS